MFGSAAPQGHFLRGAWGGRVQMCREANALGMGAAEYLLNLLFRL